jgi:hypothetical protein
MRQISQFNDYFMEQMKDKQGLIPGRDRSSRQSSLWIQQLGSEVHLELKVERNGAVPPLLHVKQCA